MDTATFAKNIKNKYPEYANIDDITLVQKAVEKYPVYESQLTDYKKPAGALSKIGTGIKNFAEDTVQDVKQVGQDILHGSEKAANKIAENNASDANFAERVLRNTGALASAGANAIDAAFKGAIKAVLPQGAENILKESLSNGIGGLVNTKIGQSVINTAHDFYDNLSDDQKKNVDAVGGITALITNFIGGEVAGEAAPVIKNAAKEAKTAIKTAAEPVIDSVKSRINAIDNVVPSGKDAFIKFVSPEIDDATKNVLKKVPTEKFDEMVKTATEAANNPESQSVFERVADTMEQATKQIDDQVKSLSQQKKAIINKAKNGLTDFKNETGKAILNINRELGDSKLAKSFIARLKKVNTKLDADNAIDELQDILYKGNKDLTIPVGSKEDKVLKSILGKYNTDLKASLPKSYASLNEKISNKLNSLSELNNALGQTIEGVPIRGASLIKQFFSPAGTKAKQLLKFIKDNTGIDVAQEAVLAKYVGEAFGDAKVRSLLEGVPTSASGAIQKAIDFTLEKTGVNKAVSEAKKKGILKKGRDLTNAAKSGK